MPLPPASVPKDVAAQAVAPAAKPEEPAKSPDADDYAAGNLPTTKLGAPPKEDAEASTDAEASAEVSAPEEAADKPAGSNKLLRIGLFAVGGLGLAVAIGYSLRAQAPDGAMTISEAAAPTLDASSEDDAAEADASENEPLWADIDSGALADATVDMPDAASVSFEIEAGPPVVTYHPPPIKPKPGVKPKPITKPPKKPPKR